MAWIFTYDGTADTAVNLLPATAGETLWYIKEALKQAGWTVEASGDGLSAYGASSDVLTSGNTGANGYGNTKAWARLADPSGTREFILQKGSSAQTMRMKFSHSAGFTGGSPSATVTPSATDEQTIHGGGTDAVPTYGSNALPTDGTYRLHVAADNAAPYGWHALMLTPAASSSRAFSYMPLAASSYDAADAAPYGIKVWQASNAFTTNATDTYTTAVDSFCSSYYKKGLSGEAFVFFGAGNMGVGSGVAPTNLPSSPYSSTDPVLPIPLMRLNSAGSQTGWKGIVDTAQTAWLGTTRAQSDYVDIAGRRYVVVGEMVWRFSSNVVPLI